MPFSLKSIPIWVYPLAAGVLAGAYFLTKSSGGSTTKAPVYTGLSQDASLSQYSLYQQLAEQLADLQNKYLNPTTNPPPADNTGRVGGTEPPGQTILPPTDHNAPPSASGGPPSQQNGPYPGPAIQVEMPNVRIGDLANWFAQTEANPTRSNQGMTGEAIPILQSPSKLIGVADRRH